MAQRLIYTAHSNLGMQQIAKAIAEDCSGKCTQNRGVDVYGRPSMTVYDSGHRVIAEIRSGQNVSPTRGQMEVIR